MRKLRDRFRERHVDQAWGTSGPKALQQPAPPHRLVGQRELDLGTRTAAGEPYRRTSARLVVAMIGAEDPSIMRIMPTLIRLSPVGRQTRYYVARAFRKRVTFLDHKACAGIPLGGHQKASTGGRTLPRTNHDM